MDKLKERIQSEQSKFEEQELSDLHFKKFESKLDKLHSKSFTLQVWMKYAAIFILPISIAMMFLWSESNKNESVALLEGNIEMESSFPLAEAELYFKSAINEKQKSLTSKYKDSQSKAIVEEYQELIIGLEEQYLQLEKELAISGDERIVVAMIKNYKTRIELLEKLILQLNYVNQLKNQNYENPNA